MLASEISKDRVMLEKFLKFIAKKKLDGVLMSKLPDEVTMGLYMDFLEQEYNIGITADNASYTIYYIPVDEGTIHYKTFIEKYNLHKGIVFHTFTLDVCTTAIDRFIAGIIAAIRYVILPF
jgi:hypothetical protein